MKRRHRQAAEEGPQARSLRTASAQDVGDVLQEIGMPVRAMAGEAARPFPVHRPIIGPGQERSRIAFP